MPSELFTVGVIARDANVCKQSVFNWIAAERITPTAIVRGAGVALPVFDAEDKERAIEFARKRSRRTSAYREFAEASDK